MTRVKKLLSTDLRHSLLGSRTAMRARMAFIRGVRLLSSFFVMALAVGVQARTPGAPRTAGARVPLDLLALRPPLLQQHSVCRVDPAGVTCASATSRTVCWPGVPLGTVRSWAPGVGKRGIAPAPPLPFQARVAACSRLLSRAATASFSPTLHSHGMCAQMCRQTTGTLVCSRCAHMAYTTWHSKPAIAASGCGHGGLQ